MLRHSRSVRVDRVIPESADAVSLVLDIAPEDADSFGYRPGQFLTVQIPTDRPEGAARCYSLSSSPFVDNQLKVTVKRTKGGYGSNWLCDNAVEGLRLQVLTPGGIFVPGDLDTDLLLCAAGSGITPVMSILKSALARGSGQVVLLYANRDESSVIFADEISLLALRNPGRLVVLHWLESLQGLPSAAQLAKLIEPYQTYESFTCGPGPFMKAITECRTAAGVPRERSHTEVFMSLSGDPFDKLPLPLPDPDAGIRTVDARVRLNGTTHEVSWPVTVPLTDVLLDNGIDAPYSCREGECGTCTAQVVKGTVRMLHDEVLDPADVANGYILTCQSLPEADDIEIEF